MNSQLTHTDWEDALDRNAPWWDRIAEAALERLEQPVPDSHSAREINGNRLSWSSDDPILNALDLLDVLLAIDRTEPFDKYQEQLVSVVASNWDTWPAFTKATALSCLRKWFWATFPALRGILAKNVTENEPIITRYAIDRTIELAYCVAAPELADFLNLAANGGHEDSLHQLSQCIGDACIRVKSSDNEHIRSVADLLSHARTIAWADKPTRTTFLNGVLVGSSDAVLTLGATRVNIDAWTDLVKYTAQEWPHCQTESRFNVHAVFRLFTIALEEGLREAMFAQLQSVWLTLLSNGELAEFCELHFEIRELLNGRWTQIEGERRQEKGLSINAELEDILVAICRVSVERVRQWKQESKTTDDGGWRSGLDGRDSADLIETCMNVSRDKTKMRRAMKPVIDVLADTGLTDIASKLRVRLRST